MPRITTEDELDRTFGASIGGARVAKTAQMQTRSSGKNIGQTPVAQGRVQKATLNLRSHAKATPNTYSTRQTRASKLPSDRNAEEDTELCEVITSDAFPRKRKPLAEQNLYMDVSPHDRTATRGTPMKKSTLKILQPGQRGSLVDWSRFNKQHRKYLNHPLSKDFDGSRASYAEELHDVVNRRLDEAHQNLIDALHNKNGDAPLQYEHLLDELEDASHQGDKETPFSEWTLQRKTKNADGTKETVVYTLQERIDIFAAEVQKYEKIIANVTKKHDDILRQIATFVAEKLDSEDHVDHEYDAKTQLLVDGLEHDIDGLESPEIQALKEEIEAGKVKEKKLLDVLDMLNA